MSNEEQIKQICTGDTLLVDSGSWLARMIKKFQKCRWNHAAMFCWIHDQLFVIESDKYGICLTPFKDYISSNKKLLIGRPRFEVDGDRYREFMLPFCGHVKYDKANLLIHQVVKYLTGKRVWIGKMESKADGKFICGEWVAYVYHELTQLSGQAPVFPDWYKIAPEEIYSSGQFFWTEFIK